MITLHIVLFHWRVLSNLTGPAPSYHPPYASSLDLPGHALDLPVGPVSGLTLPLDWFSGILSYPRVCFLLFLLNPNILPLCWISSCTLPCYPFSGHGGSFKVLDSRAMLFICFTNNSLHLLVPNSQSLPPPPSFPLATTDLSSLWVCFCFMDVFIGVAF